MTGSRRGAVKQTVHVAVHEIIALKRGKAGFYNETYEHSEDDDRFFDIRRALD